MKHSRKSTKSGKPKARSRQSLLFWVLFSFFCLGTVFILVRPAHKIYYRLGHQEIILQESKRQGLSPYLVAAVIFTESRFKEDANSEVGAVGLMQLMPDTAIEMAEMEGIEQFELSDLPAPATNIRLGTRYLAELSQHFKNKEDVLAAYNAGPSQVLDWKAKGQGIAFPETQEFVRQVTTREKALVDLYPEWTRR